MKRKFSLNMAPIKVPLPSEAASFKHSSSQPVAQEEYISPPPSPFICRRRLSPKTDAQLRRACWLVLENYKLSANTFQAQTQPKPVFGPQPGSMGDKRKPVPASQRQLSVDNRPDAGMSKNEKNEPKLEPLVKQSLPDAVATHSSTKANTSRRRDDLHAHVSDGEQAPKRAVKSQPPTDRPKTAPVRNTMDSDDSSLWRTPLTSSTGNIYNAASTAPTSAAFSSSPGSKRNSRLSYPNDGAVAAADAAAAEWMRQEAERRRQNMLALEPPAFNNDTRSNNDNRPTNDTRPNNDTRPPSRTRSIKHEILGYIRPLSRSGSKSSMGSNSASAATQQSERGSGHGWRSWTLPRKPSITSFKDSRPSSSRERSESRPDEPSKAELNLNRELPPLPSLDTWEDHAAEAAKEETAEAEIAQAETAQAETVQADQTPSTHIANLMLPNGHDQPQHTVVARHKHRRSGSDSLAQMFPKDTTLYSPAQSGRPRPKSGLFSHRPNQDRTNLSVTFDKSMDPAELRRQMDEATKRKHRPSKSTSSIVHTAPNMGASVHQPGTEAPKLSKKVSIDVTGRPANDQAAARTTPKPSSYEKMRKMSHNEISKSKKISIDVPSRRSHDQPAARTTGKPSNYEKTRKMSHSDVSRSGKKISVDAGRASDDDLAASSTPMHKLRQAVSSWMLYVKKDKRGNESSEQNGSQEFAVPGEIRGYRM